MIILACLLRLREWTTSWAWMMLLRIFIPSTYPICSSNTRVGRRGLSLFGITLEIILCTTFYKAMGMNLSSVISFYFFGIKAMKDVLSALKAVLDFLESSTTWRISCLIISLHVLKKSTLNPSRRVAYPFCISLMTSLTSSSVTSLLRL